MSDMANPSYDIKDLDGLERFAYDLEIARSVDEVGGWENKADMGVAVCSLCDLHTGMLWHFDSHLLESLQSVMETALLRVSFNGRDFDNEVLRGVGIEIPFSETTDYDIRQEFCRAKGDDRARGSLGKICQATFGLGKTGAGGDSPAWHKAGWHARNITYCGHDAFLTAKLFEHIEKYGYVVDPESKRIVEIRRFGEKE